MTQPKKSFFISYLSQLVGFKLRDYQLFDASRIVTALSVFELAAVCDVDEEKARKIGAEHGVPATALQKV